MQHLPIGLNVIDNRIVNQIIDSLFNGGGDIIATPGGTLAAAVQLSVGLNRVNVCATNGDSVKLPTAVASLGVGQGIAICFVHNGGASTLDVYPQNGTDEIMALGGGVADTLTTGKVAVYFCAKTGVWSKILTA